jgi:hypothetical protein
MIGQIQCFGPVMGVLDGHVGEHMEEQALHFMSMETKGRGRD